MAVDFIRTCHKQTFRFFTDSEETTDIQWYFTDADPIPYPTVFYNPIWKGEGETTEPLGEVIGAKRRYANGSRVGVGDGTHCCGTEEQWLRGTTAPPDPPVPVLDDGTPLCCLTSPPENVWFGTGGQAQGYDRTNTVGSGGQRQGGRGTFSPFLGSGGQWQGGSAYDVLSATGGQEQGWLGLWPIIGQGGQEQGGLAVWPWEARGIQAQGGIGVFGFLPIGQGGQQQGGEGLWLWTATGGQEQGGVGGIVPAGVGGQVQGGFGLFVVPGNGGQEQGGNGLAVLPGIGGQQQGGTGAAASTGTGGAMQGGFGSFTPSGLGGQQQGGTGSWEDEDVTGEVKAWAGTAIPAGYLACDGAAVSRAAYANLFAAIGLTWGAGDGSTTFNVPDLRGRVVLGSGTGPGLTARVIGTQGGTETHLLTIPEMPNHTHAVGRGQVLGNAGSTARQPVDFSGAFDTAVTSAVGGGNAHANMQPWVCMMAIIKT